MAYPPPAQGGSDQEFRVAKPYPHAGHEYVRSAQTLSIGKGTVAALLIVDDIACAVEMHHGMHKGRQ